MAAALLASTGDSAIDAALGGLVAAFEEAFPGRVRGYYLYGSAADGTRGRLSDVDLGIVFRGAALDGATQERARPLLDACQARMPVRLDAGLAAEGALDPADVRLKAGSVPLFGEDVRAELPWPSVAAYRRRAAGGPLHFLVGHLRGAESVAYPVEPPDRADRFGGYARARIAQWYPPGVASGTKELVAAVCWTATAVVALRTGRFVASRAEAVRAYAEDVGDEHAELVRAAYERWGRAWGYAVPAEPADRAVLAELCRRVPAFENRFLELLRDYLLGELASDEPDARLLAARRLGQVVYRDAEVEAALWRAAELGEPALREAARVALERRSGLG